MRAWLSRSDFTSEMISSFSFLYLRSCAGDSEEDLQAEFDVLLLQAAQALEAVGDVVEGLDHLRLELGLDRGERQRILHVVFVVIALGGGLGRILRLLALDGVARRSRCAWSIWRSRGLERRGGGGRSRRRHRRLHDLQMRRAGNRRSARHLRNGFAVGADHRRLHRLGVGAGIGRFQIDDVAQEDFSFVQLVAPDDDGLEGERALAEARDHRLAAGLDALGDGDFALARQQFDRAHLAQIHAHGIVGALGRLFLLGGGERLGLGLDHLGAGVLVVIVGGGHFVGGLLLAVVFVGVLGLDHVDAHLAEHREGVLDLLGGDLLGRHHGVELFVGDEAALLGGLDHLLDAGVGQVEQRQRGIGCAFGLFLGGFFFGLLLRLARHSVSPGPTRPTRAARIKCPWLCATWPKRAAPKELAPPPNQVAQCSRNPLKPRLTLKNTAGIDLLFHAGPAVPRHF